MGAPGIELVRPGPEHLPAYVDALQRGWSPDNIRGAVAAEEQLAQIAADPAAFLALMDDPEGAGPPVTLPDGTQRQRIPSLRRWMWLPGDAAGFVGSIGLRWPKDLGPLPPHVLGHIGYTVVPWHRQRGHATRGLALMLEVARAQGLREVEITTDPDNIASQRVITGNGGVLFESFDKGEAYGHAPGLRYRVGL
jgi:predicted acetyltransferase